MTARRLLAVVWTVAIFVACTVPGSGLPNVEVLPFSQDKWIHAALFAGFGWLWVRAVPGRPGAVALAGVAFAVATELWQGALPIGRSAEVLDALADGVGLAIGLAAGVWAQRQRERADRIRRGQPAEAEV